MYYYQPEKINPHRPLVVVLHGCNQNAKSVAKQTGWDKLADLYDFSILYPEQKIINNPSGCFNWFNNSDIEKETGEAASIFEMVNYMIKKFDIDKEKIFVTGLSAGAAMSVAMMSVYPETFEAGAILAGGPYKSATNVFESFQAMRGNVSHPDSVWAALVKKQHQDKNINYPRMMIFHGRNDLIVNVKNANELVKQWTSVLNIDSKEDTMIINFNNNADVVKHVYTNNKQEPLVIFFEINNLGHALPIDPGKCRNEGGRTDIFSKDKDFHSTYWTADFFKLITPNKIIVENIDAKMHLYTLSVNPNPNSIYSWIVPENCTITEGQNTNKIKLQTTQNIKKTVRVIETSDNGCIYNFEPLILK